jgi:sugar phosphate isomerase/epimerase
MQDQALQVGYCTNVHAGNSLEETLQNLERHAVAVARSLGNDRLGVGLWLPESTAREVIENEGARRLRDRLDSMGLHVFTLNGFPQGNFHAEVVKHAVYVPQWNTAERFEYTMHLAGILADLLPDDLQEGSISTLPLGWRAGFKGLDESVNRLIETAEELARLEDRTGKLIHVDLEPEPGCVLDTADDVIELFDRIPERTRRHLRVCHDVCHSAVMFEPQQAAIEAYRSAGISVGKIQVSACPEVDFDKLEEDQRTEAMAQLRSFVEPKYLHQTTVRNGEGGTSFHQDLPEALEAHGPTGRWRVHFHVPVFARSLGLIGTTQGEIGACFEAFEEDLPMLEVETYAWGVLPEGLFREDLAEGIAEELRFTRTLLEEDPG